MKQNRYISFFYENNVTPNIYTLYFEQNDIEGVQNYWNVELFKTDVSYVWFNQDSDIFFNEF